MAIAHDIGLDPYPRPNQLRVLCLQLHSLRTAAAYGPKLPLVVGLIIARLLIPQTSHRWHRAA